MDDAHSIDSVIRALYESISGPAGQPRDWLRCQRLFHPAARQVRTGLDADGRAFMRSMDVHEYRADTEPFFAENDFHEVEIDRRTWRFGNIAHVLSRYEARRDPDDPAPERRGVNSIQLYHDGSRWWILHMAWDNERAGVESHLEHD